MHNNKMLNKIILREEKIILEGIFLEQVSYFLARVSRLNFSIGNEYVDILLWNYQFHMGDCT